MNAQRLEVETVQKVESLRKKLVGIMVCNISHNSNHIFIPGYIQKPSDHQRGHNLLTEYQETVQGTRTIQRCTVEAGKILLKCTDN